MTQVLTILPLEYLLDSIALLLVNDGYFSIDKLPAMHDTNLSVWPTQSLSEDTRELSLGNMGAYIMRSSERVKFARTLQLCPSNRTEASIF